jgi:hypothetical protein
VIRKPTYNPFEDGNIFKWVLTASQAYRELKRVENNATKEASTELKRLDRSEMAYKKW